MASTNPNAGMDYTPDYNGLQPILRSPQMRMILRTEAIKAANMAKALSPRRSGKFANGIRVLDGGLQRVVNQQGKVTRRAAMIVAATSDNAITVEFGAKTRYSHGVNREGHHVLGTVAKIFSQAHARRIRQALMVFRAAGVQARPGSPGSPRMRAPGKPA
jgi:hypothetical protein